MFCTKCGSQINVGDQYCPKCGEKNEYYKEKSNSRLALLKHSLKKGSNEKQEVEGGNTQVNAENIKIHKRKWIVIPIVLGCCVTIVIVGIAIIPKIISATCETNNCRFSPSGLLGYSGSESDVYFIEDGKVVTFKGAATDKGTTPDHSKYLIVWEDESLFLYNDSSTEGTKVADDVSYIYQINNDGCFYQSTLNDDLYYYDYTSGESIDIGFESYKLTFSSGNTSVVGVNEENELFLFKTGDTVPKDICNIGDDARVSGVSDDGKNIIWYREDGDTVGIYMMMENGVPERIGKIENSSENFSAHTQFFDGGKSFIMSLFNTSQLLMSMNGGEVQEIYLPGAMGYGVICDKNGHIIDSEDDSMTEFYFLVSSNKDSNEGTLYKMTKEGKLKSIVSDISPSSLYEYDLINGIVYYLNSDNDFVQVIIDGESEYESTMITTDVDTFYIPDTGDYAYIIKSGSLYYWDMSDKNHQLNLITNKFTEDDTLRVTDKSDTIYYITDSEEIDDTYQEKGTLYSYMVGGKTEKLADDIIGIRSNDSQEVSATSPIFKQFVSLEDSNSVIINVGTIVDGKYKNLANNIAY